MIKQFVLINLIFVVLKSWSTNVDIEIKNVNDFEKIRRIGQEKNQYIYVYLLNDIDFQRYSYQPINATNMTFEGNNHVLKNLRTNLFNYINGTFHIRNLKFDSTCQGKLAGNINLHTNENCSIDFIESNSQFVDIENNSYLYYGGFIDYISLKDHSQFNLTNTIFTGSISDKMIITNSIAGLIGKIQVEKGAQVFMSYVENYANISATCRNISCACW